MTVMQQWLTAQDSPEVVVNENFVSLEHMAVYAKNPDTTTGLTWGYLGGRWGGFAITAGTVTLTASNTNYVVVNRSTGAVSVATTITNWDDTVAYARVYKLTVGTSTVTAIEDHRAGDGGVHGIVSITGALSSLSDVEITSIVEGQILYYDNAESKWKNRNPFITSKLTVSSTAPSSPATGDLWVDTSV